MKTGDWIVTIGGSATAKDARVISIHRSYERAEYRARCERSKLFEAGDITTRCGVEHVATFVRDGGKLP